MMFDKEKYIAEIERGLNRAASYEEPDMEIKQEDKKEGSDKDE